MEGEQPQLGDLLTMVINHVSKSWDDPPSKIYSQDPSMVYLPTFTIKINRSCMVNIPFPWILTGINQRSPFLLPPRIAQRIHPPRRPGTRKPPRHSHSILGWKFKDFPTYPWNIPQTPNQRFMKEFLSFGGFKDSWGMLQGYVEVFLDGCW